MGKAFIRQRNIIFPDTITNYQYETILNYLNEMDDVLEFEISDDQLQIKYNLKQISFDEIWSRVRSIMLQNQYKPFIWWKYNLIAQLEANEKDHLVNRYGWYEYIADIFVNHHTEIQKDANKNKLWQKYTSKEKTGTPE